MKKPSRSRVFWLAFQRNANADAGLCEFGWYVVEQLVEFFFAETGFIPDALALVLRGDPFKFLSELEHTLSDFLLFHVALDDVVAKELGCVLVLE